MIALEQIDVNVVEHCNRSCANCSHVSPLLHRWEMDIAEIEHDLGRLKPILSVEHVNIVGGEPTLHPQIVGILRVLKSIRIDKATRVITNGSRVRVLPDEFWDEVEILRFSDYGINPPDTQEWLERKAEEHEFTLEYYRFTEFFRQFKSVADEGAESFAGCPWKDTCHTVHRGKYYRCPQSTFFHRILAVDDVDGVALEGITEDKLRAFIDGTIPLEACRHCDAAKMEPRPWVEANRKTWMTESRAL